MENNSKISMIYRIVANNFFFLEEMGYKSKVLNEDDSFFLEDISVEYLNDLIKRKISINYTKGSTSGKVMYNIGLTIVRIPYEDTADFFSLDQYLNSLGKDVTIPFAEFSEKTLNDNVVLLAKALKDDCYDIITGDVWKSEFGPTW